MYHRFPGTRAEVEDRLSRQCEHLRRYYQPISLSEMAEALRQGRALPKNGLAITVDDGYRDFQFAFPVFQAYGMNVTLYVVAEFAEGNLWLWPDQVKHLFYATRLHQCKVPLPNGEVFTFELSSLAQRQLAIDTLNQSIIRLTNEQRLGTLQQLPQILQADLPACAPGGCESVSWQELRNMAAKGLEVGAHTRTHPILSSMKQRAEVENEIGGAKKQIEDATGVKLRHFCYPNGKQADYHDLALQAVRDAGYESAVIAEAGLVSPSADPLQMPRIGVEPEYEPLYFERCVAGFRL